MLNFLNFVTLPHEKYNPPLPHSRIIRGLVPQPPQRTEPDTDTNQSRKETLSLDQAQNGQEADRTHRNGCERYPIRPSSATARDQTGTRHKHVHEADTRLS